MTEQNPKTDRHGRGPDAARHDGGHGRARTGTEISRSASGEGPTDAPPQPVSRISKDDLRQFCWCGCEQLTSSNRRWRPGHDQKAKRIIKRAVKEGKIGELSPQLKEYGAERGLI